MDKFFMVMRYVEGKEQPHHLRPAVKHFHPTAAFEEAKRLSVLHPGETFIILAADFSVGLPFEVRKMKTRGDGCFSEPPDSKTGTTQAMRKAE